jgi:hypothetical protein
MNLVQIDENTIVDKDKVYALVGNQYDGKFYTHVYMEMGNEEKVFLVKGNVKEVGALLMENNDGRVC